MVSCGDRTIVMTNNLLNFGHLPNGNSRSLLPQPPTQQCNYKAIGLEHWEVASLKSLACALKLRNELTEGFLSQKCWIICKLNKSGPSKSDERFIQYTMLHCLQQWHSSLDKEKVSRTEVSVTVSKQDILIWILRFHLELNVKL